MAKATAKKVLHEAARDYYTPDNLPVNQKDILELDSAIAVVIVAGSRFQ